MRNRMPFVATALIALIALIAGLSPALAADRGDSVPFVTITDPPQDAAARQAIIDAGNLPESHGGIDCCFPNGTPGCTDATCQATVCGLDPFCCDVSWDSICAAEAIANCQICRGYCCAANGTPGCNDAACETTVCGQDSFCCAVAWDDVCADQAQHLCDVCITQAIPTVSKTGLGILAAAMLLGGALLLRRRRAA